MKQFIVAAAILAGMAVAVNHADAQADTDLPNDGQPVWIRPCLTEDGTNCYWDSRTQGNGVGHSFFSIRVGGKDCLAFVDRSYARTHNRCIDR